MPLSYTKTWEDVRSIFAAHADLLIAIAGVFLYLPNLFLQLALPEAQITGQGAEALQQLVAYYSANIGTIFLLSIPVALGQATILALVLDPSGLTVGMAIRRAISLLLSFIVLNALVNLSVMGGFLLLFVPGLYLIGRTYVAGAALVAENTFNPLTAFSRGLQVTRGNGWRVFGILLIIFVVGLVLSTAVASVFGVVVNLAAPEEVARIGEGLVQALVDTVVALVLVLLAAALYRQLARA